MQKKLITIITIGILITSCVTSKQKFTAPSNVSLAGRNPQLLLVNIDKVVSASGNLVTLSEKPITIPEVFKRVRTIILETNKDVRIGEVNSIQVYGDEIFISDIVKSMGVFVFNKEGRYIWRIGKVGQGPGEYTEPSDFTIDKKNKLMYVLDSSSQNILKYNLETGTYISTLKVPDGGGKCLHIQCVGDKLYGDAFIEGKGKNNFLIQEIDVTIGQRVKKWLPASVYNCNVSDNTNQYKGMNVFYDKTQESPKFVQLYMDTVMTFNEQGVVPFLAVKTKDFIKESDLESRYDPERIHETINNEMFLPKIRYVRDFITYKNLIYFFVSKSSSGYEFIYNSTTGETAQLFGKDNFVYLKDQNNSFTMPRFYTSSDDGMYRVIHPKDMPQLLKFAKEGKLAKNLDKLDQLMKLDENTNPIIFVYE